MNSHSATLQANRQTLLPTAIYCIKCHARMQMLNKRRGLPEFWELIEFPHGIPTRHSTLGVPRIQLCTGEPRLRPEQISWWKRMQLDSAKWGSARHSFRETRSRTRTGAAGLY